MVIYQVEDYVKATYEHKLKAIIVRWHKFQSEVHPCVEAQLECIEDEEVNSIIVDTSQAEGRFSSSDVHWFEQNLFKELDNKGIKAIITVSDEGLTKQHWKNKGKLLHMDFVQAETLADALKISGRYV